MGHSPCLRSIGWSNFFLASVLFHISLVIMIGLMKRILGHSLTFGLVWFVACSGYLQGAAINIVTTTTMITDTVEQIGGDRVWVEGLMGPGVDPHLYKPAASDVLKLSRAKLVFYNGLLLEGKMSDLLDRLNRQGKAVYAVTENIDQSKLLKPEDIQGHWDPHIWGDPRLWVECVKTITNILIQKDPSGRQTYQTNRDAYVKKLENLMNWGLDQIKGIDPGKRVLVTSHDAFNYFGNTFGLQVVGVQGISTVAEAPLADIIHIVDFIKSKKVPAVFVESSVSPATIKRISEDSGAKIGGELFSDALGTIGEMESYKGMKFDLGTYEGWLGHNIATISKALTAPDAVD